MFFSFLPFYFRVWFLFAETSLDHFIFKRTKVTIQKQDRLVFRNAICVRLPNGPILERHPKIGRHVPFLNGNGLIQRELNPN